MTVADEAKARAVAAADQVQEEMAGLARITGAYFTGLIDAGMTREEALSTTLNWQDVYLAHVYGVRFGLDG